MIESEFDKFESELVALFESLIPEIGDDYRATDDSDDDTPGMCVTVATDDSLSCWSYQTGDNSFTGGAYGLPHWAVVYLYRHSSPLQLAIEVANQWADLISQ